MTRGWARVNITDCFMIQAQLLNTMDHVKGQVIHIIEFNEKCITIDIRHE